ncbi:MAG: transcriptional regulator [Chloracidobacterium sp. CP2_5A]|nr:MAG: transcriptional regulator [Chloracidobacterium sp. CP2_5A]
MASPLPRSLQQLRRARRISQMELSFRLGVSQRHISFVESGRSKPSRELLLDWLQTLDAPLGLRNELLLQAGYAPAYAATPLTAPALARATQALAQLLQAHDPMPAMVLDAQWNLIGLNRGAAWLAATLLPWAPQLADGMPISQPVNMLDLFIHPEGLVNAVANVDEIGMQLLEQLRQEASAEPAIQPKVEALADLLRARIGGDRRKGGNQLPSASPALITRYTTRYGPLAFFMTFTTFGRPQDITLASLRVEHLFAADEATRATLARHVP